MAHSTPGQPRGINWTTVATTAGSQLIGHLRNQRAQQRALKRTEEERLKRIQRGVKAPSMFVYVPLTYIAIVADIFGLLDLTGIGAIAVFVVNVFMTLFFIAAAFWLNRKIKRVRVSGEQAAVVIRNVEQRTILYRQRLAVALRVARRTRAGRSILRSRIGRTTVGLAAKLGKATRMPIVRSIAAYTLELVPYLNLVPWYTINMVLTYREHKKEHLESVRTLATYQPASTEEGAAFADLQRAEVIEVADAFQQTQAAYAYATIGIPEEPPEPDEEPPDQELSYAA